MTRFAILSFGALGLAVIARAAIFYAGVDSVALAVCLAMAAVMVSGLVELYRAAAETDALRSELSGFAKSASVAAIERTSPVLRALLRARLERVALPVPTPVFTPYFVGLLVMLGLLGTFLGLFETLRGARIALAASADVDALRAGLERPMAGLMRSFGASAAGVSGSALLGLASVFVRRLSNLLSLELHACVSGPLSNESPTARQLEALVALARQGESLPLAARSLEAVVTDIRGLSNAWGEAQRTTTTETLAALEKSTAAMRAAIEKSTAETAATLLKSASETSVALAKSASDSSSALAKSASDSSSALAKSASESAAALAKSASESAATLTKGAAESRAAVESSTKATHDLVERSLSEARAAIEKSANDSRLAIEKTAEASRLAIEKTADESRIANASSANESRLAIAASIEAIRASLQETVVASAEASQKAIEPIVARGLEQTLAATTKHVSSLASTFDAHVEALTSSISANESERLGAVASAFESAASRLTAETSERASRRDAETSERAARLDAQMAERAARLDAEANTRTERLARDLEGLVVKWSELTTAYETVGRASADREVERAQRLAETATRIETELGAAATAMNALVAKAAEASRSEQDRAETLFARLSAASTEVATAASSQAAALEALVSSARERASVAEERSDERLTSFLTKVDGAIDAQTKRLDSVVESQALRIAEFEELVRTSHERSALALAEQLAAQAKGVGDGLAETTSVVREAAGLIHAGGAELSSVAEAFSDAVGRQQRAADEWLANLGRVEAAVAEAGESAAADALGQHLAHTHELFDRQLRFQTEVYDQLRGLRRALEVADVDVVTTTAAPSTPSESKEEVIDGVL